MNYLHSVYKDPKGPLTSFSSHQMDNSVWQISNHFELRNIDNSDVPNWCAWLQMRNQKPYACKTDVLWPCLDAQNLVACIQFTYLHVILFACNWLQQRTKQL